MRHHLVTLAAICAAVALSSCASANPDPEAVPEKAARPMTAIRYGDCTEALRRASNDANLDVDRLPQPVRYDPPPIPKLRRYPAGVFGKDTTEVRIQVLVDTLGRPEMATFRVVKSTHPWLSTSLRSSVSKWRFTPAELVGCKVPRLFNFAVVSAPKGARQHRKG